MPNKQSLRERVKAKIVSQDRTLKGESDPADSQARTEALKTLAEAAEGLSHTIRSVSQQLPRSSLASGLGGNIASFVFGVVWVVLACAILAFIILGVIGLLVFGLRQLW